MALTLDITVNGTVAERQVFLVGFLRRHPRPEDFVGTDAQWPKEWLAREIDACLRGAAIATAQEGEAHRLQTARDSALRVTRT